MAQFTDIKTKFAALAEEIKKRQEEIAQEARASMLPAFQAYFEQYPSVQSIVWAQYTDYWNDGDECHFHVHDYDLKLDESSDYEYGESLYSIESPTSDYWAAYEADPEGKDRKYAYKSNAVRTYKDMIERVGGEENLAKLCDSKNALKEIFSLPDSIFKQLFGDHVKVVATRNGFDIQHFDHE